MGLRMYLVLKIGDKRGAEKDEIIVMLNRKTRPVLLKHRLLVAS